MYTVLLCQMQYLLEYCVLDAAALLVAKSTETMYRTLTLHLFDVSNTVSGDMKHNSRTDEVTCANVPHSVVLVIVLTTLMEAFTTQVSKAST
jgi:hypothetical protein